MAGRAVEADSLEPLRGRTGQRRSATRAPTKAGSQGVHSFAGGRSSRPSLSWPNAINSGVWGRTPRDRSFDGRSRFGSCPSSSATLIRAPVRTSSFGPAIHCAGALRAGHTISSRCGGPFIRGLKPSVDGSDHSRVGWPVPGRESCTSDRRPDGPGDPHDNLHPSSTARTRSGTARALPTMYPRLRFRLFLGHPIVNSGTAHACRPVRRLDPRPLERPTPRTTKVPALRIALVGSRCRPPVAPTNCTRPDAGALGIDRSVDLRHDRVRQDPRDPRNVAPIPRRQLPHCLRNCHVTSHLTTNIDREAADNPSACLSLSGKLASFGTTRGSRTAALLTPNRSILPHTIP